MRATLLTRAVYEIISNFQYDKLPLNFTRQECTTIGKQLFDCTQAITKQKKKRKNK